MKPIDIGSSIGVDRLATWNEVIRAMSVSPQGAFALAGGSDDLREADSAFSGIDCNLSEEAMWLALVGEMADSKIN